MLIVFIHCDFPGQLGDIVNTIARFAVPIFFMVSGYFNYSASKEKLKSRVLKLLKIFAISSVLYIAYDNFENLYINGNNNFIEYNLAKLNLQNIFNLVVFNFTHFIYSHLWFILALMYCYIFRILTKDKKVEKIYKYIPILIIVGYVLNIYFLTKSLSMVYLTRNWILMGVPFYILGHLIKGNTNKITKISKLNIIFLAIAGLVLSVIERLILKSNNIWRLEIYIGSIIFAVSIFILAVKEPKLINIKLFKTIGEKYSLNIYIIHYLIIEILRKVVINKFDININGYILPIAVFIISYIFSIIIYKLQEVINSKKENNMLAKRINKKSIIVKIIIGIILVIPFICMLKMNLNTHIYHDEFVYSSIYGTKEKIASISDIFKSAVNIYTMHNGRIITHMVLMIFLQFNSIVRCVINSAFFVILIYELIKFQSKKDLGLKIPIALLLFPMLWCTIPAYGDTVLWIAGSVNYLWTTVALLLYIFVVESIFEKETEFKNTKLILFCIASFILASLHEMTGIISIGLIGLMSIYLLIKNRKINKTLFLGAICGGLGFLSIILSPGSNVRKMAELQTMDVVPTFLERLKNTIIMLKTTIMENKFIFAIIAISIIFMVIKLIKNRKEFFKDKQIFEVLFLLCTAVVSYIAMVVSPTFLTRVTFIPYIIFVYSALKCLHILNVNNKIKIIEYIILILAIVVFTIKAMPMMKETFELVKQQKQAWEKRDEDISMQIEQGKKDIYVEPLNVSTNTHLYYGDLSTSISYNPNGSMAVYYDVNSIRIKGNYYLDIEISNVNEKNKDSIKISAMNFEETKKFYLLDENIYNKMAPYKKFKNSYSGGNITLYYAMGSIENLKIVFLKEQEVTINKIKLYTPDEKILEVKGQEMLKYFDLNNVEIENETENDVTLKTQANSEIFIIK